LLAASNVSTEEALELQDRLTEFQTRVREGIEEIWAKEDATSAIPPSRTSDPRDKIIKPVVEDLSWPRALLH
jgi:hypothetical protein